MKSILKFATTHFIITYFLIVNSFSYAQVGVGTNYPSDDLNVEYFKEDSDFVFSKDSDFSISVSGLANVKPDLFIAVFAVNQISKTTSEANKLIDERINNAVAEIKKISDVEIYVDLVSFVPLYEFEAENKLFSKKTYNEIPNGFEIKKNIHVKFSNLSLLNKITPQLSKYEIYDIAAMNYYSKQLEAIKNELISKVRIKFKEKIKNYEELSQIKLDSFNKKLADNFKIIYPTSQYKSYKAYANSSLKVKSKKNVNQVYKNKTLFYQEIVNDTFDVVINPVVLEPSIQIEYKIKLLLVDTNKKLKIITHNGDLKSVNI